MKKKYVKPAFQVINMDVNAPLLAGSGTQGTSPENINFNSDPVDPSAALSRGHSFGIWGSEDE